MFKFIANRLQNKLILAFVLVLLIPTTIIAVYTIVTETNTLIATYRTDEVGLVQSQAAAIGVTIDRAKNALLYLAQSPVTTHYVDSLATGQGDAAYKADFTIPAFKSFLQNSDKSLYKDVRILDKTGQEIIRVDNSGGVPVLIPDSELENKSTRPYFIEAAKLPLGNVYGSGLDLNTTKGKIDVPYLPVIRYSTPLFAKDGTFGGVMVIKMFAETVLAPIHADDPGEHVVLVDSKGAYWLNPDSSKLYGQLVQNDATLQRDQPSDAQTILSTQDDALLASKDRPDLAQVYVHVTLPGDTTASWTIIHQQPIGNVFNEVNQVRNVVFGITAVSLFIAILAVLFITRRVVQPIIELSVAAEEISLGNLNAPIPPVRNGDEIGQLTAAFHTMTGNLQTSYESLARRATEMETVATVSANAASILDLDVLLQTVSDLTKDNFGLYHAHVYLLDETGEKLVLKAGAGEPGRIMKSQGRSIELSNPDSLVARAGRTRQGVIINDVTKVSDFLPNPLLPNTRAEMAVAMVVGDELIGVLDVQADTVDRFAETDAQVMNTLAHQVAVAVGTARAYVAEESNRRHAERLASELQTVAKVSAAAATSLNKDELLQNVTNLVKSSFNLYHAHIYLLDETGEKLVLSAGAGEAGRIMKNEGRSIALSNLGSIVARTGRNRQGVIVNDVTQANDFLPNPLLPDTRAEMAVPMVVADVLVGVLDVQADTVDYFTESDAEVLTTLGDQVAVAVQNAQLFEQQLETTEQLRAVDQLKSEFLASMSHELRTPLNSIIGYSRMLLDSEEDEFSEDAAEDLSAIHNGGKHLLSLINDILDLAKIEANKMELDQEGVNFESVAQEVAQMTSILLKGKSVSMIVDIPHDLPDVWADRVRLRQVLNNLVSNAIKFTEKGEVRISASYNPAANEFTASVKDTGIGIAQEKIDLVFERFTQVDSSSARKAGGTGLGLTITRHLIEMHGGRIWAESAKGKGSTFSFTMPLVTEPAIHAN